MAAGIELAVRHGFGTIVPAQSQREAPLANSFWPDKQKRAGEPPLSKGMPKSVDDRVVPLQYSAKPSRNNLRLVM